MTGQLSKKQKRERVSQLCRLAEEMRMEFFEGLVGSEVEVLIEKSDSGLGVPLGFSHGHTRCYTPVKIKGVYEKNDIVKVNLVRAEEDSCTDS